MKHKSNHLRIIGGQWRSRLVAFVDGPGVRPTPDRVRQTLYDWLAPHIEGAVVLDLFAGSGALGLEALSRGAAEVAFVERGAEQAAAIRHALALLKTDRGSVHAEDALSWLRRCDRAFDIVLLDPPYDSGLLPAVLELLPPRLKPGHRVYLEWPAGSPAPLPAGWTLLKEKQAGAVSYALVTCHSSGNPS